ncbi:MAG: tetratricopeptide repeat protein [Acidobacteriaceae bacterium]|nr:tetratricopeptide repeat protein [Acidobacteriaceae bacterium]MBV9501488.1 tetratricopeptide repeat protein [Acidobacteriaceae bacterium]
MSTPGTPAKAPVTPRLALIAIIALVIAGLTAVDRFLAKAQESEVQHLAQRSHADGVSFRRTGKINDAIEAFRKAHALEPKQTEYELDLIDSLIAARKLDQAELLMRDALDREPNDGRANLLAAHLMIANGKPDDAESYYHRAIYGEWPSHAVARRVSVRMELSDFLAARGKHEELLAELLPLQEEAGKDPATRQRLAPLFLAAGSPSRAADEYRALIKQNRNDAAAYVGLGEAELQLGEYGVAHEAFLAAAARKSVDPSIQQKLEVSSTLMGLDPTPRKLTSIEKYRRSLQIMDLARSSLESCGPSHPELNSGETGQLLTSANQMLTSKPPAVITNELAEDALSLAEQMWQARLKTCGAPVSPSEESLRLIMEKLAQ